MNSNHSLLPSIIWIHIIRQWYEFILYSIIWIHTYLPWYEFIFVWYSQSPTQEQYYNATCFPENRMVTSINNLLCLTSDLNTWTSNFVVPHGDQSIDVSSAAQGALSSSPLSGAFPHQTIQYPCAKYYFDKNLFFVLMVRIYS